MTTYRACIFCNRTDSRPSNEHVIATWIAHEISANSGWTIKREATSLETGETAKTQQFKTSSGAGLVSGQVCTRCNNTWMRQLEDEVKPILVPLMNGDDCRLKVKQQMTVIHWFLKVVMAYEFLGGKERGPTYFSLQERQAFMNSFAIPEISLFFMASCVSEYMISARELPIILSLQSMEGPVQVGSYTATFVIKHLVIQIVNLRWPRRFRLPKYQMADGWENFEKQLGRTLDDITWPPRYSFNDKTLDQYFKRWLTVAFPRSADQ